MLILDTRASLSIFYRFSEPVAIAERHLSQKFRLF